MTGEFRLGQTEQIEDRHPPGQGLCHPLHQMELLGTGKPVHTWLPCPVDGQFDPAEQLGGVLDLVDDDRRGMALQK